MKEKLLGIISWLGFWWLIDYLWINQESLSIFAILLALDFIFWIVNAYLNDRQSVRSRTATRGLINKLTKLSLPLIVVIILKWVWFEDTQIFISSIMGILIVAEGYSIIGHIYSINTNKQLPEIDAFWMLIEKIVNTFRKIIDYLF